MRKGKFITVVAILLTVMALGGGLSRAEDDAITSLEKALDGWDVAKAAPLAQKIISGQPTNSQAHELAARLSFYQGDYSSAMDHFREAIKLGGDEEKLNAHLDFAKDSLEATKGLKLFESPHFKLYLDASKDAVLADYTLNALELFYSSIEQDYGFKPESKVRVELFPDTEQFYKTSTLSVRDIEVSGAVGLCKFNKIMLLSPRALLRGYRWLDAVTHEYVHYVVVKLSNNKAPIWFHEGLAKYEEARWRSDASLYLSPSYKSLLAAALSQEKFVGFKNMEPSLVRLDSPEQVHLAYAESASAIDFIIKKVGRTGLKDIMKRLAERSDQAAVTAAEDVMRLKPGSFEAQWLDFLKGQEIKEVAGAGIHRYKVARGERVDDDSLSLEEIKSAAARNHIRLGDILRSRGRIKPAIIEYKRGLERSPNSPSIITTLSKALILNAEFEQAIGYLKKAVELDEDNPSAYKALGEAYLKLNRPADAAKAYWESVQINPFDPEVHRNLLISSEASGLTDRASVEKKALESLGTKVK